jgi:hypothetical protein
VISSSSLCASTGGAFYDLTRLQSVQRAEALRLAKVGSRAVWPMISDRCIGSR